MNIILSGCNGKMGHCICNNVQKFENFKIVLGIDKNISNDFDFPVLSFLDYDYYINKLSNINNLILIDFSHPSILNNILDFCLKTRIPAVICTTGYSETQISQIYEASSNIPVFYSQNMSIGVNLLVSLAKKAVKFLGPDFDIEIIERHHNQKIDAPSGTAYMIANEISKNSNNYKYVFDRTKINSKRTKNEIGIHSVRAGSICGDHEVIFAGQDEVISVLHHAQSRDIFAIGALRATKFLISQKPGLYNMKNLID